MQPVPVQVKLVAEKGDDGKPLFDACYECVDLVLKIRPNLTMAKIVGLWKNTAGARMQDPELKKDYETAKAKRALLPTPPVCNPPSEVAEDSVYGFCVYREKGLLTAEEYYELTDRSPEDDNLDPIPVPWASPGENESRYLIELKGLPFLGFCIIGQSPESRGHSVQLYCFGCSLCSFQIVSDICHF